MVPRSQSEPKFNALICQLMPLAKPLPWRIEWESPKSSTFVNPQHLILIHCSKSALHELSRAGDLRDKYWIHIPDVGDTITFGQAPEHLSKAQVARLDAGQEFELEIEAEFDGAWLRIADSVLEDPRWQHLAATGLLSAKWTKGGLMLKPASHKSFAVDSAILSGMDCCAVCEFFDGYLCRGEESPLYKRDVDPAAKCPAFVRQVVVAESIVNGEESVGEESILFQRRSANEEIEVDLKEN
jgi:hypothetical protein